MNDLVGVLLGDFDNFSVKESYETPSSESDIVNNPYSLGTNRGLTASSSFFAGSDYYPSEDDEIVKGKVNCTIHV